MTATITVGRIVHYTDPDAKDDKGRPVIVAAIITAVSIRPGVETYEEGDFIVSLKLFNPTSVLVDLPDAPFKAAEPGTDDARGHWNWPAVA